MITVFTSCYNQGEYLREAIESVLSQTYEDFEYLLYNDGSTDNTKDIMMEYAVKDKRIRFFDCEKVANVGVLLNRSIKIMQGDNWVWCPSDDRLFPELLQTKKDTYASRWNVLYSDWTVIDGTGKQGHGVALKHIDSDEFANVIFTSCPIGFTGIWIPKSVFNIVGGFREDLPCSEDYEWMLQAVNKGVPFVHIPECLYQKRHHDNRGTFRNKSIIPETVAEIRSQYK